MSNNPLSLVGKLCDPLNNSPKKPGLYLCLITMFAGPKAFRVLEWHGKKWSNMPNTKPLTGTILSYGKNPVEICKINPREKHIHHHTLSNLSFLSPSVIPKKTRAWLSTRKYIFSTSKGSVLSRQGLESIDIPGKQWSNCDSPECIKSFEPLTSGTPVLIKRRKKTTWGFIYATVPPHISPKVIYTNIEGPRKTKRYLKGNIPTIDYHNFSYLTLSCAYEDPVIWRISHAKHEQVESLKKVELLDHLHSCSFRAPALLEAYLD